MKKNIFLLLILLGCISPAARAQRFTDRLDRGLVVGPTGAAGNSSTNLLTWRRLSSEQFGVTYNVYKDGSRVATGLNSTCYADNSKGYATTAYQVAAVVNGVEQARCTAVTAWDGNVSKIGNERFTFGFLDIDLAPVYDRSGTDVTAHYSPNDAEMADLDGDGQLEIIIKRLNTVDASISDEYGEEYSTKSTEFVVIDAYDVNWQTGAAQLMWRIDCGPNMVSLNSTEINVIAFDWDEDGRAEVVLRGADNMIVYGSDGKTQIFTVGDMAVNTRNLLNMHTNNQYEWTHFGREYLIYMNGQTGAKYQVTDYPLPRIEQSEWPSSTVAYNDYTALEKAGIGDLLTKNASSAKSLNKLWGDHYGHRSTKHFLGAPFLDGRKASLFLGRGIYTRHKMIAMDLDRGSHQWKERWRWQCNNSNSPWYGNGYHNFVVADVDEDGRDEIVYGSMVIDDNGHGLSTTGYQHGDAQQVGDLDPYRKGLEFFGCLEDGPFYGFNYRNATTGEVYHKFTAGSDDGRALMANFTNSYPGCVGRSSSSVYFISSVTSTEMDHSIMYGDSYINYGDLNFRIYWDGDLCSEIMNSPGTAREAKVEKPGKGRLFTSSGCNMNNDSKNNACFMGDIIGDWREEMVVRRGTGLRVYTSAIYTGYSFPTLWNDHQYRQAMVWQMMAYNQPPYLSYFLGELEGITVAPPTLTTDGRTEIANGGTVSGTSADQLLMCETNDMTVSVADGASPAVLVVNAPTWVQGTDVNGTSATKVKTDGSVGVANLPEIVTTTYTHTLTGGGFAGQMRLVKQGDGVLVLPDVEQAYTGATDVWAGTLRFGGRLAASPLWLNRFATLETDGGEFLGGITADYAATIRPGEGGLTTTTLTLNHGARLAVGIGPDGKATPVNADRLVLNTKSGDAWEQYGPEYLKPVLEITDNSGLADATIDLGAVGTVAGSLADDLVVEGLSGDYRIEQAGGHLYLILGTGETAQCPEATFSLDGYHLTDGGLLPVVSILPGTLSYSGIDVVPAVAATFNGEPVDLATLYSDDFETAETVSGWSTPGAAMSIGEDAQHGKFFYVNTGTTNTRYAYTRPGSADVSGTDSYTVEFDLALKSGNTDGMEFCVMSKGGTNPTNTWDNYAAINGNANMLFDLTAPKNSTAYTVNGTATTTTLDADTWYHITLSVDRTAATVAWAISNGDSGTFDLPAGTSADFDGFYLVAGRYWSTLKLDNISIRRTGGLVFAFPATGTLEVTSTYPGCQPATASYEVTQALTAGDVNQDGVVNIVDVAMTVSYILGREPEGFLKAAADIDGDGTVDQADVMAIAGLIGW